MLHGMIKTVAIGQAFRASVLAALERTMVLWINDQGVSISVILIQVHFSRTTKALEVEQWLSEMDNL